MCLAGADTNRSLSSPCLQNRRRQKQQQALDRRRQHYLQMLNWRNSSAARHLLSNVNLKWIEFSRHSNLSTCLASLAPVILSSKYARPSPYDIIDIEETATAEEIKRRYRQLSLCALQSLSTKGLV